MKNNKLINNPYAFWERIFSPPKDELGRPLKFKKSKIMKKPMYRVISLEDWQEALKTGKFKTSLPIKQDEAYLNEIKEKDKTKYKQIIHNQNARKFTRVTPKEPYAWKNSTSDLDVLVKYNSIYKKLNPSTEYGGDDELFACGLSVNDVSEVVDKKGNIIYKKPSLEKRTISTIFISFVFAGFFFSTPSLTGNVIGLNPNLKNILGILLTLFGIIGFFYYNKFSKQ